MDAIVNEPPPGAVGETPPTWAPELDRLVLRLLAKDPRRAPPERRGGGRGARGRRLPRPVRCCRASGLGRLVRELFRSAAPSRGSSSTRFQEPREPVHRDEASRFHRRLAVAPADRVQKPAGEACLDLSAPPRAVTESLDLADASSIKPAKAAAAAAAGVAAGRGRRRRRASAGRRRIGEAGGDAVAEARSAHRGGAGVAGAIAGSAGDRATTPSADAVSGRARDAIAQGRWTSRRGRPETLVAERARGVASLARAGARPAESSSRRPLDAGKSAGAAGESVAVEADGRRVAEGRRRYRRWRSWASSRPSRSASRGKRGISARGAAADPSPVWRRLPAAESATSSARSSGSPSRRCASTGPSPTVRSNRRCGCGRRRRGADTFHRAGSDGAAGGRRCRRSGARLAATPTDTPPASSALRLVLRRSRPLGAGAIGVVSRRRTRARRSRSRRRSPGSRGPRSLAAAPDASSPAAACDPDSPRRQEGACGRRRSPWRAASRRLAALRGDLRCGDRRIRGGDGW